jgi:hypothetical protein
MKHEWEIKEPTRMVEKQKKKDVVMASVCAMSVCVSVCCEKYVQ